jgi:hypothetical protein
MPLNVATRGPVRHEPLGLKNRSGHGQNEVIMFPLAMNEHVVARRRLLLLQASKLVEKDFG